LISPVSTHSHPKVAAEREKARVQWIAEFQHTATRRWLLFAMRGGVRDKVVSTHSHPKVAAFIDSGYISDLTEFQHTATRRWLPRT